MNSKSYKKEAKNRTCKRQPGKTVVENKKTYEDKFIKKLCR